MHEKSPRNAHEKIYIPIVQCSKTHAVDRPAKLHQNAFAFVVTGVALRTPWMQNRSKSLKFYHKITTKSTNAVVAMVRNARCRSTCEHASKRVDFCRSRCCFAHAMDANSFKIVENHRWQHVICRRSCPPRGGPIRSVLPIQNKNLSRSEGNCCWKPFGSPGARKHWPGFPPRAANMVAARCGKKRSMCAASATKRRWRHVCHSNVYLEKHEERVSMTGTP